MFVQISTDNRTITDAGANARLEEKVRAKLKRYESRLSDVEVHVTDMRVDGNDASVHLSVHLMRNGVPSKAQPASQVLSTGVTVPVGQTVVLGTSATDVGQRALILTVRPQLVPVKK